MEYITVKGQRVSRYGFGTAGFDGIAYGIPYNRLLADVANAERVIGRARELGITLFDTAPVYGTEELLAKSLGTARNQVLISTKSTRGLSVRAGWRTAKGRLERAFEDSLRRFGHIDYYFFHTITKGVYARATVEGLIELAFNWKKKGDIRFVGVSEDFKDAQHGMIYMALKDGIFDVVMGVPNITFPYNLAKQCDAGMFAIRAALPRWSPQPAPQRYRAALNKMDVVLIGTSSVKHLEEDVE